MSKHVYIVLIYDKDDRCRIVDVYHTKRDAEKRRKAIDSANQCAFEGRKGERVVIDQLHTAAVIKKTIKGIDLRIEKIVEDIEKQTGKLHKEAGHKFWY